MRIQNSGRSADRLVAASSPVAGHVEVRAADGSAAGIELPARGTIELKPGGPHLLLADLKRPLAKSP